MDKICIHIKIKGELQMEIAKDRYANLELSYSKIKRRGNMFRWMERHMLFTAIVAFTLTFSIINIILIMKFFSILVNL